MTPEVKRNVSPGIYSCFLAELLVIRLNSFAILFTVFVFSSKIFVPTIFKFLKGWVVIHEGATDMDGLKQGWAHHDPRVNTCRSFYAARGQSQKYKLCSLLVLSEM